MCYDGKGKATGAVRRRRRRAAAAAAGAAAMLALKERAVLRSR